MASSSDNISMAVFCDFENVALGVRDANYEKFDIKPVLERLLLKGSIVVKKAYCDWERYKGFKATMHEANFELIEIPHVRQSGKNSADIRLVVDALDLCYTKSHVNTFVIISGDSDFSPLVSKLRENNKQVIGVGVKQSTSDLLVANCDEFIFYDDLVREVKRAAAKRDERKAQPAPRRPTDEGNRRKEEMDARKSQAIELVVEMFDALVSERGDSGKIWASLLKDTLKRRRPDFNETYYGFRTFGNLLEEAQNRGMLEFGRDEKSGAYVYRSSNAAAGAGLADSSALLDSNESGESNESGQDDIVIAEQASEAQPQPKRESKRESKQESGRGRGRGRGGRKPAPAADAMNQAEAGDMVDDGGFMDAAPAPGQAEWEAQAHALAESAQDDEHDSEQDSEFVAPVAPPPKKGRSNGNRGGGRKTSYRQEATTADAPAPEPIVEPEPAPAPEPMSEPVSESAPEPDSAPEADVAAKPARKSAARKSPARARRPAKPKAEPDAS